jgi:hypothetical protein
MKTLNFTKIAMLLTFMFIASTTLKGQFIPESFYQTKPNSEKELATTVFVSNYLGFQADYSLTKKISFFSSVNYYFVPRKQNPIFGDEYILIPSSLNFNAGAVWFPTKKNNWSLGLSCGRIWMEEKKKGLDGKIFYRIKSSIIPLSFQTNYIITKNRLEHYITFKVDAQYIEFFKESINGVIFYYNENKKMMYDFMPGYGLKYTIGNLKLGMQAGLGFPFNIYKNKHEDSGAIISQYIGMIPVILNLNAQYCFNLKKEKR